MKKSNIEELINLMKDTSITEISWTEGETNITLKQAVAGATNMPQPMAVAPVAAPAVASSLPVSNPVAPAATSNYHELKSPMVGTFYEAPSPDEPTFVKVGDKVKKGQVMCIIEAMKLMNEIECDKDGVIEEICVSNEAPVEYDTVLFKIS